MSSQIKGTYPQWISAICSVVAVLIAAGGLAGLMFEYNKFIEETEQERRRLSDETLGQLYLLDIDIKKMMASSSPTLRRLIFDDRDGSAYESLSNSDDPADAEEIQRARLICGLYGNLVEYYLFLKDNLYGGEAEEAEEVREIEKVWGDYFMSVAKDSYIYRLHIVETAGYWSDRTKRYVICAMEQLGEEQIAGLERPERAEGLDCEQVMAEEEAGPAE